jgi:hypothetical protein
VRTWATQEGALHLDEALAAHRSFQQGLADRFGAVGAVAREHDSAMSVRGRRDE